VTVSWIDAIGPGWLTDVLRAAGVTKAAVWHIETHPLGVASAAGELARLSLTFEPMRQPGPVTIIAKAPGRGPTQRAMDAAMGLFARERFVYAELASALPVRLPRCYHVGDQGKNEPMLLEDLGALRAGDQVTGLDQADAERLIDVLAELHAAFWESGPPGGDPSRLVSWTDPALGAMLTQLVTSGVAALRQRYAGRAPAPILTAIAEAARDWAAVLRRCAEGPQTLVHNDFRLDNIFFQPDGQPVIIDWQLAGRCRAPRTLPTCCRAACPATRCAPGGTCSSGATTHGCQPPASAVTTWRSAGSTTAKACSTPWPPESRCSGRCNFAAATTAGSPTPSCCAP
jgi:hypothetical protein